MTAAALAHVAATVLAIEVIAVLLAVRFPELGTLAFVASVVLGSAVGWFSYAARKGLANYISEMEFAERAMYAIVFVLLFACPSLVSWHWEPALGGVAVLAALTATLSTPATFLVLYGAAGIAQAAMLPSIRGELGDLAVALFLSTFLVANVADHFAFRSQFLRLGQEPTAHTILVASLRPLLVTLLVAVVALLLLPEGAGLPSRELLSTRRALNGAHLDGELENFGNTMFRVASLLMVISGVLFFYWLHRRWRLRRAQRFQELEDEMFADYFMELSGATLSNRRLARPRTLRGKIIAALERFFDEAARAGFPRREPMTVLEYITGLRQQQAVSAELTDALLSEFLLARYANAQLKKENVQRFSRLVEQAIADLRARLSSDES